MPFHANVKTVNEDRKEETTNEVRVVKNEPLRSTLTSVKANYENPADSQHHGFHDRTNEYEQIIKESLREMEQNQQEEKLYLDMLKDTIVQSK